MIKPFKLLSFIVTLFLIAGALCVPVLADPADAAASPTSPTEDSASDSLEELQQTVNVTVRVESGMPEDEKTLIPPTGVTLKFDPLLSSWQATPLEALTIAADGDVEVTESGFGSFLSGIMGVSDETGVYSWMYTVNNEIPESGVDSYTLSDGDEVVFYFINWENAEYAYFTPEELTVSAGESLALNLKAVDFSEGESPVEGAMLSIVSDAPTTRELNYTDADGNVELSFFAPGEYFISAGKQNEDGIPVISRPYCAITVTDEAAGDEASVDLPDIQPMPMPVAPITYDSALGTLNVYGTDVDITGLQVIFDEGENELYLPLRAVAEALGAAVYWDAETSWVNISLDVTAANTQNSDAKTVTSVISFNSRKALEANEIKNIENRIYVPSRFIIDNFGA